MKNETPEKQLVAKIRSVNNILVTVSRDPSVDQLVSALGLTLALNKLGKRSVAVFSGQIPEKINFLEPQKTFENNADSLRDFIISLSKDKADRLKVRPDGDFVKVYITPYRTKIVPDDLSFSEGNFNIELIIAIGVADRNELDASIASHGKIFHNSTTATLNLGQLHDALGMISWQNGPFGSYAEMCYQLIDSLGTEGKDLIDNDVATALLTGVVAATDQFRNSVTSPAIMTLSANLMAKGANQQLITAELSDDEGGVDSYQAPEAKTIKVESNDEQSDSDISFSHDDKAPAEHPEIADSIERRLQKDREDFGANQNEEALRAAQRLQLEMDADKDAAESNSVYGGAGNVPDESFQLPTVEQSNSEPVAMKSATPAEPVMSVDHTAPAIEAAAPVISTELSSAAQAAAQEPAPEPIAVATEPVASSVTSELTAQSLGQPLPPFPSGIPQIDTTGATFATAPVEDSHASHYLTGQGPTDEAAGVLENSDDNGYVLGQTDQTPVQDNSLPFNQPNSVSPITVTPDINAPLPPAPLSASEIPPMPANIPVEMPLTETTPNPAPTTTPEITTPEIAMPPVPPLPPAPVAPDSTSDLSAMPPILPAAPDLPDGVTPPTPQSAPEQNDPSQFVVPSYNG